MRRLRLTFAILALTAATTPTFSFHSISIGVWENRPEAYFSPSHGLLRFAFACQGPDFLVSINPLTGSEVAAWFSETPDFLLTIDGEGVPFQMSYADIYWRGWDIGLRYLPDAASAGWLERSVTAEEIAIVTPTDTFLLPRDDESRAEYARFVAACEEERFSRHPIASDYGTIALPPPLEASERAVIYELPHRSLETTTVAATVVWRFENGSAGPVIVADIEAPERGLVAELTISVVLEGPDFDRFGPQYDFITRVVVPDGFPGGGFKDFIWIRPSRNEIGHRQSGTFIDPFNGGEIEPNVWMMGLGQGGWNLVLEADLIELGTDYKNATYALIVLEKGETGRAVFAEAMAAWGLAPAE